MCIAKQYPDYTTFSVYCNSKKTTDDLSLYKSDFGDIADNCEKEGGRVYYLNVGLISYDELYYAAGGTKTWVETDNLYVPFYPVLTMTGYNESMIYLTPSIVDEMGEKTYQGRIDFNYYTYATNKNFTDFPTLDGSIHPKIYPVINLVYNVKVSGGDGTYDNPYKVVILI